MEFLPEVRLVNTHRIIVLLMEFLPEVRLVNAHRIIVLLMQFLPEVRLGGTHRIILIQTVIEHLPLRHGLVGGPKVFFFEKHCYLF
jgi:hypothetical protein